MMTGHGSPSFALIAARAVRAGRAFAAAVLLLGLVVASPAAAQADAAELQIKTGRALLIFAPGEQFTFELQPVLPDVEPHTTVDIRATLSAARGHQTVWSSEPQRVAMPVDGPPTVAFNVPLPRAEGAYTLRVTATRPSGFRVGFFPGTTAPLAERTFDLVVLDGGSPRATLLAGATAQSTAWENVLEIDPTSARWWERLPTWTQLRRIPGLKREPLGSLRAGAVDLPLGRFVELPPSASGADPHWQAYSLPLEAVGVPHLLEIEFPPDQQQQLGISIVEPNAAGVVEAVGRDTGVYVEGFGRSEARQRETHRLIFWPRTQAPLLLVTNGHPTAAAHFGHIRVLKRREQQAGGRPSPMSSPDRLVAAYMAKPLLAETFGATRPSDSATGSSMSAPTTVSDWQTFWESATRLAEYLRYSGYNAAVVNVFSDGVSLYPSSPLAPPPQLDHGRTANELAEPDGMELLLRVFDREGLALVPALQFATPLPELEALRHGADPAISGLEWIGPDGRSWLATSGADDGRGPLYNLLDPRVQQAMLDVAAELLERYGQHRSMSGLAVQLSATGYAQLPPLEWGLDDATMSRFARDTGIELAAAGPERFAARHAALTGEHAEAWRAWRAARVAEFYRRLAELVREENADRRLLVTFEESLDHPRLAARARPVLLRETAVERTLLDLGIDRPSLEKIPGVVLCPTRYVGPTNPLGAVAVDLEINQATTAWRRKASENATAAALLYHRAQRRRVESFESKAPFKFIGESQLVAHPLAHGHAVRQAYIEALLDHDPAVLLDGGQLLPLGQEEVLRPVRAILGKLPASAAVEDTAQQPVVVRSYVEPDRVTLLVVNASPWTASADITLDVPQAASMEPLVPLEGEHGAATTRALPAGKQAWSLSLAPYAAEAVRISVPGVKVAEVRAQVADAAKAEISARLADLESRDLTAPRVYAALANPSFEPLGGAGATPGWRLVSNPGAATAELDATSPQHGRTCLYLHCTGEFAAIESNPFPAPATGQLGMAVFLRGQSLDPRTSLRIVFESEQAGHVYRRVARLDAQPQAGWGGPRLVFLEDLPLGSAAQMRVRFELTGPGEIWLDNVILHDLLLPLKLKLPDYEKNARAEVVQLLQIIHAAKSAFEAGRLTDSVRLLEGYWPRFMTAHTPLIQPAVAVQPAAPQPSLLPPADQKEKSAPGMSDRIKRIVPFWR